MNDSKLHYGEHRRATDGPVRARTHPNDWDNRPNWLDSRHKAGGRHSAITRNLYSWSSYKSWADKVRSSWERDK